MDSISILQDISSPPPVYVVVASANTYTRLVWYNGIDWMENISLKLNNYLQRVEKKVPNIFVSTGNSFIGLCVICVCR